MPKPIAYIALVMIILASIPPAIIARTRAVPSERRRIHFIQDMDNQGKFRAQQANPMFADGRAMRLPVEGAIAREDAPDDDHFTRGLARDEAGKLQWASAFPAQTPVNAALMERGEARFSIYCRPCHGDSGHGDGIVNKRAMELLNAGPAGNGTTWVQPKNLHEPQIRIQPPGQLFNTITHGIRTMAGYESQIPIADRWAIVAYVKALQRSQNAKPEDVPAAQRASLPLIPLPKPAESAPAPSAANDTAASRNQEHKPQ